MCIVKSCCRSRTAASPRRSSSQMVGGPTDHRSSSIWPYANFVAPGMTPAIFARRTEHQPKTTSVTGRLRHFRSRVQLYSGQSIIDKCHRSDRHAWRMRCTSPDTASSIHAPGTADNSLGELRELIVVRGLWRLTPRTDYAMYGGLECDGYDLGAEANSTSSRRVDLAAGERRRDAERQRRHTT